MIQRTVLPLFLLLSCALLLAAQAPAPKPDSGGGDRAEVVLRRGEPVAWAIAIHGGAGTIPRTMDEAEKRGYLESLDKALRVGRDTLAGGGTGLDAIEKVIRVLEDDPRFNAGKGAVFTHEGSHELDAAIMNGRDLSAGAVALLKTVKNPISLARMVMERSPHVFLAGEGAERFADAMKVERVDQKYFHTQRRWDQLQEALRKEREEGLSPRYKFGTVGVAALDRHGDLAAGTSSGGLTNKRFGRLGDVPVIGAGTYANNRTCAISATGWGEKFIRYTVAHDISALMEYGGLSLQEAAERVIHGKLEKGDGGVVGVARDGSIAMVFNSEGMYRGAADGKGRFEVKIWE